MILKPTAVDIIIQSSTVELLRSYDVFVAPRGRKEVKGYAPDSDLVGIVGFDGPSIAGNLILSIPSEVYNLPSARRSSNTSRADWTRELTNQVMGRIKNRLAQFRVQLRTYIPSVLSGAALDRHKRHNGTDVLYDFGALRGEINVVVDVSLTRAVLEYSNASILLSDGDLVLFD
jgi:CheY-specific phosphatase CheX